MTNVRGTGWDWPRNKFSLPIGARGRQKYTRLPKIKDQNHYPPRKHKHARQELHRVAASSSQTPTIKNQAQPRKIERLSRRSNMEISRTRTPRTIISSNASHITPPANTSTEWFVRQAMPTGCTKEQEKCLEFRLPSTSNIQRCQSLLIAHHKYLPTSYKNKGCQTMALIKIPGCNKTKGAERKGDSKEHEFGAREKRVPINYNTTRERVC